MHLATALHTPLTTAPAWSTTVNAFTDFLLYFILQSIYTIMASACICFPRLPVVRVRGVLSPSVCNVAFRLNATPAYFLFLISTFLFHFIFAVYLVSSTLIGSYVTV